MSVTLSGLVCLKNAIEMDYCWVECIESILPVCDEVVICESGSSDDTCHAIATWMRWEPKLKLCVWPWPNPKGNPNFYIDWIQYGRAHINGDYLFHIDADEIIDEHSQAVLAKFKRDTKPSDRISLIGHRYNFWNDAKHLIPHGVCLSHIVTRIAPKDVFMPSDGAHPEGRAITEMAVPSRVRFYHYGFLRKPEAYFKKSRQLHGAFFNTYDDRLVEAEASGGNWMENIPRVEWTNRLVPFTGEHPEIIKPWLKARGHL